VISDVNVTSTGSNYSYVNAYVIGDGTGAVFECTLNLKQIISINVVSSGHIEGIVEGR
jgi:CRISPR/Cas system CMR subunit Cmr6 (Cas7 group RAMP superfamily)